jgi:hypothetical protein
MSDLRDSERGVPTALASRWRGRDDPARHSIDEDPVTPEQPPPAGAVTGSVRAWLRAEGLAVLALSIVLYWLLGGSWLLFALLFLAPDLSFAAWLGGPKLGAAVYNLAHAYVLPLTLLAALLVLEIGRPAPLVLIWLAHLGFDRALGFGLKYPAAFGDTHLGRLGRRTGG